MNPAGRTPLVLEGTTVGPGIPLYLQPAPASSVTFAVTVLMGGGTAEDPPGREGASTMVTRLLSAGTRRRDKRAFSRELDRWASTFGVRSTWEGMEAEVRGPRAALEPMLELLFEALQEPRFDPREVERVRRELQEALAREESQPDERGDRTFLESLFPAGHPYHRNPLGTARSVRSLRREDLLRFHRDRVLRRPWKIVVTSALPPPRVRSLVEARAPEGLAAPATSSPVIPPGRRGPANLYIGLPGSVQVEVTVGGPAPPRSHPDHPALVLANEILGGRPLLSRLVQSVREDRGLAYGAGSELECLRQTGLWTAEAGTDAGHVAEVERLLVGEIASLASRGPKPGELDRIRRSFLGSLPLSLETAGQAHHLAVEVAYFDLPLDHFLGWSDRLRSVPAKEVRRVVDEHLDGGRSAWVVAAGPPDGRPTGARAPRT